MTATSTISPNTQVSNIFETPETIYQEALSETNEEYRKRAELIYNEIQYLEGNYEVALEIDRIERLKLAKDLIFGGSKEKLIFELNSEYLTIQESYWTQKLFLEPTSVDYNNGSQHLEKPSQASNQITILRELYLWHREGVLFHPAELYASGHLETAKAHDYTIIYDDRDPSVKTSTIPEINKISLANRIMLTPISRPSEKKALIVSDDKYANRNKAFALPSCKSIIMPSNASDIGTIIIHEDTHLRVGGSFCTTLSEGLSVYMEQIFFGNVERTKVKRSYGANIAKALVEKGVTPAFSHNAMLIQAHKHGIVVPEDIEPNEYTYRSGAVLIHTFIRYHDLYHPEAEAEDVFKKFLRVYELTQRANLYSNRNENPKLPGHGKPLITNGEQLVQDDELITEALQNVGIDPHTDPFMNIYKEIVSGETNIDF